MKLAYLLFFSVCFILFGGYYCGYANTSHESRNSLSQTFAGSKNVQSVNVNLPIAVFGNTGLSEDKAYILSFEDEDEDLDFSRRYVLLVKCFVILSCSFTFSIFYKCNRDTLPFFTHLSYCFYKYILQRVLRI